MKKEGREEDRKGGREEERKKWKKEDRKGGRKEGMKEGRKERCVNYFCPVKVVPFCVRHTVCHVSVSLFFAPSYLVQQRSPLVVPGKTPPPIHHRQSLETDE